MAVSCNIRCLNENESKTSNAIIFGMIIVTHTLHNECKNHDCMNEIEETATKYCNNS